jgi:uncharacterized membrane protein YphA (DoxX/SURF4 family)
MDGALTALDLTRLAVAAFLAVLFLQSGIDKVVDRKSNLEWLTGHFAKSPLASLVVPMVGVITVVELAAGALSALGVMMLLLDGSRTLAALGALLATTALLMLFFGQRLAKDYAGAAALVPYFIVASGGLALMTIS